MNQTIQTPDLTPASLQRMQIRAFAKLHQDSRQRLLTPGLELPLRKALRQALREAEAEAQSTGLPALFFPELLREKTWPLAAPPESSPPPG